MSKLSWSHFLQVLPLEDQLARNFYLTMAADQRWSKRTLKSKIDSMLYERTAIAKQPDEVIIEDLDESAFLPVNGFTVLEPKIIEIEETSENANVQDLY